MNIKRFAFLILLALVVGPNAFAQKLSHDELVEVLGIRSFRLPLLKDDKSGWTLKIIDHEPRSPSDADPEQLDFQNKSLIVLRGMGKNTYQFIIKQREATSRGEFEIDICPEMKIAGKRCDNRYDVEWYVIPMPVGDGLKYVIADITLASNKPVKQIILEPSVLQEKAPIKERSSPEPKRTSPDRE